MASGIRMCNFQQTAPGSHSEMERRDSGRNSAAADHISLAHASLRADTEQPVSSQSAALPAQKELIVYDYREPQLAQLKRHGRKLLAYFFKFFGRINHVHGLGLGVGGLELLSKEERSAELKRIKEIDQSGLEWKEKLILALKRTTLSLPFELKQPDQRGKFDIGFYVALVKSILKKRPFTSTPAETSSSNREIVEYLRKKAVPGSIVFVTGSHKQSFLEEVFDNLSRRLSERSPHDHKFPFVHVMICLEDGRLMHIRRSGLYKQTWEQAFLENCNYQGIAIGRLEIPPAARLQFSRASEKFAENKSYNKWWLFKSLLRFLRGPEQFHRVDDSFSGDKVVCLDLITEPLKALQKDGIVSAPGAAQAFTPLDLFNAREMRIRAAVDLQR